MAMTAKVTCPLCLGTFEDPRTLPCQHVYCNTCLDALASRGGNVSVTCPECRVKTGLSEGGVGGLPVAFQMNRLKELVAKMILEEGKEVCAESADCGVCGTPNRRSSVSCARHPSQTLDVYCCKCKEIVCRDCILFDKKHAGHPISKLGDVTKQHREGVEKLLASLLQKQPAIQKGDQRQEKKRSEVQRFQSEADRKVQHLESDEMTVKDILSEVSAVQGLVERGLKMLSDVDFMTRKKGMIFKINEMHSCIDNILKVHHESDVNVQVIGSGSVEEAGLLCDRYLQPYKVVDPLQCTATATAGDACIQVGETVIASIVLRDSEGTACCFQQCVTVKLCSARFGERVSAKVVLQSASCYEALYTPSLRTRGNCQLLVKVNGCLIGNEPMPVFVECPTEILGEPVYIINNIQQPGCLKIANNGCMFCRSTSGICIFDINNTSRPPVFSRIFPKDGRIQKWWPCEMAVNNELEFLFISDLMNGMVHKFTFDGRYVRSTDTNKVMLSCPNGLSVAGDGNVYVCDSENHCIHILNQYLRLVQTIGSQGTAPGKFNWPDNIAFDSSGQFYVTECRNHRIQCFTSDAQPKWCAGRQGDQPGELNSPNVMQVVGRNIFITDRNGVSVFTTSGQFVTRFACMCASSGPSADGIAVDKDGFVFVSDSPRNRIIVF